MSFTHVTSRPGWHAWAGPKRSAVGTRSGATLRIVITITFGQMGRHWLDRAGEPRRDARAVLCCAVLLLLKYTAREFRCATLQADPALVCMTSLRKAFREPMSRCAAVLFHWPPEVHVRRRGATTVPYARKDGSVVAE